MNEAAETDFTQEAAAPAQSHSQLGVASFVISLIAIVATIAVVIWAGYAEVSTPGGLDNDQTKAMVIGFSIFGCIGLLLLGTVLGIVALFKTGYKKTLPAVSVGLSITFIVFVGLLMWIGASAG